MYGHESFLRIQQLTSHRKNFQHSVELEGSLPYSQEPANDPYSEPDERSQHSHPISLRFILIICSLLLLFVSSGHFPSSSPTKTLQAPLSHARYMLYPLSHPWLDLSNNIWRGLQLWSSSLRSFLQPPIISTFVVSNIPLYTMFPNTRSLVLPLMWAPSFKPMQIYRTITFLYISSCFQKATLLESPYLL
jgi:hypothetical protein